MQEKETTASLRQEASNSLAQFIFIYIMKHIKMR